jgi:hypothetical protein
LVALEVGEAAGAALLALVPQRPFEHAPEQQSAGEAQPTPSMLHAAPESSARVPALSLVLPADGDGGEVSPLPHPTAQAMTRPTVETTIDPNDDEA